MYNWYILVILLLIVINRIRASEEAEDSLVLIHAFIRHGDRTPDPITSFPKDLYKNNQYYPFGEGELIQKGRVGSYQLGKQLHRRYNKFLGPNYYNFIVSPISSEVNRCRMTMQLLLAAMFIPDSTQAFKKNLLWQPIPIHYISCNDDDMICYKRCLPLFDTVKSMKLSLCRNTDSLRTYLTEHTGLEVNTMHRVLFIQDNLKSETENNLTLPKWAESVYPEPITTCGHDFWRSFVANTTLLASTGGPIISKIMKDTKEKINGTVSYELTKIFVYVGHDYNIYLLLAMLNHYNNIKSNYLDYLLFEVHKINGIYGYKIFFDHQDGSGLIQLEMPNCGFFCSIDEFDKLMEGYLNGKPCEYYFE